LGLAGRPMMAVRICAASAPRPTPTIPATWGGSDEVPDGRAIAGIATRRRPPPFPRRCRPRLCRATSICRYQAKPKDSVRVEARLKDLSDDGSRQAAGPIAAAFFFQTAVRHGRLLFVAMNQVFGTVCSMSAKPKRPTPELAEQARPGAVRTVRHRRGTRISCATTRALVGFRESNARRSAKAGWNKASRREGTDSRRPQIQTIISKRCTWTATPRWRCCRTSPSEVPEDWFPAAGTGVPGAARAGQQGGGQPAHARPISTFYPRPGRGWLDKVDEAGRTLQSRIHGRATRSATNTHKDAGATIPGTDR